MESFQECSAFIISWEKFFIFLEINNLSKFCQKFSMIIYIFKKGNGKHATTKILIS